PSRARGAGRAKRLELCGSLCGRPMHSDPQPLRPLASGVRVCGCAGVRGVRVCGRAGAAHENASSFAEPPRYTLDPELPLDEAFRFLEDHDLARVPVTEDDRLVGVLSRSSLQRRLAEDEPPPLDEDPGTAY